VDLVREIDRAIFNPVWQQVRIPAPWGDDGETLGAVQVTTPAPVATAPQVPVVTEAAQFLSQVAAHAMNLEPGDIPA
jgi:nitrogenase molybdenum-cofactor synthesis protein NifE